MTERDAQLRALYAEHRLKDQSTYYRGTADEYADAAVQASRITTVLMSLTVLAAAGFVLHLFDWSGWAIFATGAPALAAALATYEGLYGFERNAKLYGDAARVLEAVGERFAEGEEPVARWIDHAEAAMRREQSQWGQLSLEAEPPR